MTSDAPAIPLGGDLPISALWRALAGTNKIKPDLSQSDAGLLGPRPVIVLFDPQLGENIGAAARAMYNFGLADLRIVRPRDGWPSEKAVAAASGASLILDRAEVFSDERAALGEIQRVYATTARPRELVKHVLSAEAAVRRIHADAAHGVRSAILFGGERAGLTNDQISLADVILTIPVNPAFASLNLAQAVLLVAYEWFRLRQEAPDVALPMGRTEPATKEELYGLFEHLERELDEAGFLFPPHKRPHMVRNIRTTLARAELTGQDVRTWRGIIKALVLGPHRNP